MDSIENVFSHSLLHKLPDALRIANDQKAHHELSYIKNLGSMEVNIVLLFGH